MWRVPPHKTMIKLTVCESRNFDVQWWAGNTAVIRNVCGVYTGFYKGKKKNILFTFFLILVYNLLVGKWIIVA